MLDRCPGCAGEVLERIWTASGLPVMSNLLLNSREEAKAFATGDLTLTACHSCGLLFNATWDPAASAYSPDYEETQGYSPRFQRFMQELIAGLEQRHALAGKHVVEIGCGKGEFLQQLVLQTGAQGLGIDPAWRPGRLGPEAADRLRFMPQLWRQGDPAFVADLLVCRHTLEHIGPVRSFLRDLCQAMGRCGTLMLEVPDTRRILAERAFWDIYYEHVTYFTAGSLARVARAAGFRPTLLERGYGEQYLLLEAVSGGGGGEFACEEPVHETVEQAGRFGQEVTARIANLSASLMQRHAAGQQIVLWGSGSKAVACLSGLGPGVSVEAVVDINPHKWGKFMAGTGHEIVAPADLARIRPDLVVIMNPIYLDEIGDELSRHGLRPELTALG